jgi:hypothetical protein
MRRKSKKLGLHRETLLHLDLVRGGSPPSEFGSECRACLTIWIPITAGDCTTGTASACGCTYAQSCECNSWP